jgi:hypothetical protein
MANDRVRYQPNRREMRRLMQSDDIARLCRQAAENAKSYAEGIAPRESGEYARSFKVETRIVGDRQTAVLFNTAPYATVLEIKHRILGRAADHAKP